MLDDLALSLWEKHPSVRLALVVIVLLDFHLRLRFIERVVRLRKVFEISAFGKSWSIRERWFRWTTLRDWLSAKKRVVEDNGKGYYTPQNVVEKLKERRLK